MSLVGKTNDLDAALGVLQGLGDAARGDLVGEGVRDVSNANELQFA